MKDTKIIKLPTEELIEVSRLYLDPNNPRFAKHRSEIVPVNMIFDEEVQKDTIFRMFKDYGTNDIEESMLSNGFINIDRLLVRKIDKEKYLVIEGNRRVSAVKQLLDLHKKAKKEKDIIKDEEVLKSLKSIPCTDITNLTSEEVNNLLGKRHYGSILAWDSMAAAFKLYDQYIICFCKIKKISLQEADKKFKYDKEIAENIASEHGIKLKTIKEKLEIYHLYLQIKNANPEVEIQGATGGKEEGGEQDKFSIIYESLQNKKMRDFFGYDDEKFSFSEKGVDRFINLVFGNVREGVSPVITAATFGEATMRDLSKLMRSYPDVVETEVLEKRRKPAVVYHEEKAKEENPDLTKILETIKEKLDEITAKKLVFELSERDKELARDIKEILEVIENQKAKTSKK